MVTSLNRQLWISFSIIGATILVATVALYFLVLDIGKVTTEIMSDKASVEQQTGSLGLTAQLKQNAPQAAVYEAAIGRLLPSQDGLLGFNQWISGAAAVHQVQATVAFGDTANPPVGSNPGAMDFSLTATGGISDIVAFLADIESKKLGFLLRIDSVDVTSQGNVYKLMGAGSVFFR